MPCAMAAEASSEMGLGAGGKMKQEIYPDEYGVVSWNQKNFGRVYIHIVNSMMYREITRMEPPPTPITAKSYTECGLPWFALYDEAKGDIPASKKLSKVKSVKEMDKKKGFSPQQDDTSVKVPDEQIKELKPGPNKLKHGN